MSTYQKGLNTCIVLEALACLLCFVEYALKRCIYRMGDIMKAEAASVMLLRKLRNPRPLIKINSTDCA